PHHDVDVRDTGHQLPGEERQPLPEAVLMEVSLNWLRKYVDLPDDPAALSAALTSLGLEIEGMKTLGAGVTGVVAAEVLECAKHPEADKLSVCKVTDGVETYPVVCGAPNVAKGQKVLLAK